MVIKEEKETGSKEEVDLERLLQINKVGRPAD